MFFARLRGMKTSLPTAQQISAFQKKMLRFYRLHGRHTLPFRKTQNPYRIAVSEIMLQQTQVDRVIPFYRAWITKWPSWRSLAIAPTRSLLASWSGLGYNRRALHLRDAARIISKRYHGKFPTSATILESLPGFGPYTARAVLIFAFNANEVTVDTNIRRVLIYELHMPPTLSVQATWQLAKRVLPLGKSRDWHNALMDYAALRLPKTPHILPLSKQKPFKGSLREIRGAIIRELTSQPRITRASIARKVKRSVPDVTAAIRSLKRDGLVSTKGNSVFLS